MAVYLVLALFFSALSVAFPLHPLPVVSRSTSLSSSGGGGGEPTTTITIPMLETPQLRFNIDPDIKGVGCARQFAVNINVKDAGDPSSTSAVCNAIRNLLVGGSDDSSSTGNSDINLFFTCPGQTLSTGEAGDRDIKIVLNTVENPTFDTIETITPGTMTVTSDKNKFIATTSVNVGVTKSSNSELIWRYITCP